MSGEQHSWIADRSDLVLITGANGFVGSKVLEILIEYGFTRVRCLLRSDRNAVRMRRIGDAAGARVEFIRGNLLSKDVCRRAVEGVAIIYHLAAGTGKSFAGCFADSVVATRNLLDASLQVRQLRRFVNVGSLAEYSGYRLRIGAVLDERSALESQHMARFDPYCYGKIKQDELVARYGREHGLPHVIVRPGPVYGPGKKALTGRLGVEAFGVLLHVGGRNALPLIYVDNCAEAIVLAGLVDAIDGEVFNAVDDDLPRSREFLLLCRKDGPKIPSVWVPYRVFYWLSWVWEWYSSFSRGQFPPVFNRRQCAAYFQHQRYSNAKLKDRTGWVPRVRFPEASKRYFRFLRECEESS